MQLVVAMYIIWVTPVRVVSADSKVSLQLRLAKQSSTSVAELQSAINPMWLGRPSPPALVQPPLPSACTSGEGARVSWRAPAVLSFHSSKL